MTEEDLIEAEKHIDEYGVLSGDDTLALIAEVRRLRRVRSAAERVDAKYREDDPWIDPTQLFEELCWLGTVLVETRNGVSS